MAHPSQRQGYLFDINELSAKIWMFGPVAVKGIKIALWIQESNPHLVTCHDEQRLHCELFIVWS